MDLLDARFTFVTYLCVVKERVVRFINGRKLVYINLFCLSGGDNRDRTGNLQLAKLALSQLSYIPGNLVVACPEQTVSL